MTKDDQRVSRVGLERGTAAGLPIYMLVRHRPQSAYTAISLAFPSEL